MSVTISTTNKPLNPRAQDLSPKGYNRASLYSGKALDFDGVNDYVNLDGFTLSGTTATFSFAFNSDDLSVLRYFFDASDTRFIIGSGNIANYLTLYTPTSSFQDIVEVQTGEWYKLDISINGTSAACYLNGQLVNTLTIGQIDLSAATLAKFGSARNGAGLFYNGKASNFKIFNTALTAGQVSDLYNNPEKIVPDGVADSALKLWLPMMEGAGTTVYDGSGNGNHGTISGATWVSGVGAPVAQTALVGWNKTTNLLVQSNSFDITWTNSNTTETGGQSGYDGTNNAWLLTKTSGAGTTGSIRQSVSTSGTQTFSVYAKKGSLDWMVLIVIGGSNPEAYFDLTNGVLGSTANGAIASYISDAGNGYYRCSIVVNESVTQLRIYTANSDGVATGDGGTIYIQDAQLTATSDVQPYVETFATAQTSPVLLPQGLTANKDIFWNSVSRNAYALNLDGKSWAEVHDNASLDITPAMTMECWAQIDDADGFQVPLAKFDFAGNQREYLIYYDHTNNRVQFSFGHGSSYQSAYFNITATGQWFHLAATTTGSIITPYVNGVAGSTAVQTTALAASTIPLTIGSNGVYTDKLPNQIALPRIYNRALTATEVARNYNADKSKFGL